MLISCIVAVALFGISILYINKEVNNVIKELQSQHEAKITLLNKMIEKKGEQTAHAVVDLDIFYTSVVGTLIVGIIILFLILFLKKKLLTSERQSNNFDIQTGNNSLPTSEEPIPTSEEPDPTLVEPPPKPKKKK